jgi:hypothetical protein
MSDDAWDRAVALEREERLDDAVSALRTQSGAYAGYWQSQAANLFQRRATRLWKEGKADAAREAARQAIQWAREYASGATSGSEGAMYAQQVRDLERQLARILENG